MGARFKNLLLIAIAAAILVLPFAYALTAGRSKTGETEAVSVLVRYLRASYARDYQRAYRLLSSADQQVNPTSRIRC
jgi:hypothetical protein